MIKNSAEMDDLIDRFVVCEHEFHKAKRQMIDAIMEDKRMDLVSINWNKVRAFNADINKPIRHLKEQGHE